MGSYRECSFIMLLGHKTPKRKLYLDYNGVPFEVNMGKPSLKDAALALGITYFQARKIIKIMQSHGKNGLMQARWAKGRPLKDIPLNDQELTWILSERTLRD